MQVLVVLADAANRVVTRQALFARCWGSSSVGDDSLNRAVAAVRRIAQEIAASSFEVETIPRTGYRLKVEGSADSTGAGSGEVALRGRPPLLTRRAAVGTALGTAALLAGGLGLWSSRSEQRRKFEQLMARGESDLDSGDRNQQARDALRQATEIRPDDVRARGLFAYSLAYEADSASNEEAGAAEEAEREARSVLAEDPQNSNARLAMLLLQRANLDIANTDTRLRAILRDDPTNIYAMRQLWNLLQSAGRCSEAMVLVERAITLKPFAAANNFPRAQLLWILGRVAEADRVIDRALRTWPAHKFVRFARFTIFAYTGRPSAALAMLDQPEPLPFGQDSIRVWRLSLAAFEQRSPATIAAARNANVAGAAKVPSMSGQAVMTLCALGDLEAAFEIADKLLLFRQPVERRPGSSPPRSKVNSTAWRFSPWLFTPPLAPLRADPRFETLCEGVGLTEYWAKRGIVPDYRRGLI